MRCLDLESKGQLSVVRAFSEEAKVTKVPEVPKVPKVALAPKVPEASLECGSMLEFLKLRR